MGRDKRWVEVAGAPLLSRAVDAVRLVADEVHVVTSRPSELSSTDTGIRVDGWFLDRRPGAGPLAAIESALADSRHEVVLVVAGDHPFLQPEVLRLLVESLQAHPEVEVAALETERGPQPLLAAYRRDAVSTVTRLLGEGERRATALLEHLTLLPLRAERWQRIDPDGRTAIDLDTPADLHAVASGASAAARRATPITAVTVSTEGSDERSDVVVAEEPLEIRAHGPGQEPVTVVTTLRTPGNDTELAVGWLFSEGLLRPGEIREVSIGDPVRLSRPDDQITVELTVPLRLEATGRRHAVATASCGVCGRASIDELASRCAPVPLHAPPRASVTWEVLAELPDRMRHTQAVFADTGGIHATGLFRHDGALVTLREDVGRHNALDAAIGRHVMEGSTPLHDLVAMLSGRVGYELVAKAAVAGIPVVAAVGAATDLAIRTADRLGITLVSFLRDGAGNVHTHPARIAVPGAT